MVNDSHDMVIAHSDVSVVIQGPVAKEPSERAALLRRVDEIRRIISGAEVIISTWDGTGLATSLGREVKYIESADPGATPMCGASGAKRLNNLNRQIISTRAGLSLVQRDYVVKLRTDCRLTSLGFLDIFCGHAARCKSRIYKRPIVVASVFTRNPAKIPMLFHVSDLFQFGTVEDLSYHWNAPLANEPRFTQFNMSPSRRWIDAFPGERYTYQCSPEQYLVLSACRRAGINVDMQDPYAVSMHLLGETLRVIGKEYIVAEPASIGLSLPCHLESAVGGRDLLTHQEWVEMNRRLSGGWMARWSYIAGILGGFVYSAAKRSRFGWSMRRLLN